MSATVWGYLGGKVTEADQKAEDLPASDGFTFAFDDAPPQGAQAEPPARSAAEILADVFADEDAGSGGRIVQESEAGTSYDPVTYSSTLSRAPDAGYEPVELPGNWASQPMVDAVGEARRAGSSGFNDGFLGQQQFGSGLSQTSEGTGGGAPGAPTTNATLQQLADYLNAGYWAFSGYQGTGQRHWAPGATVTVNMTDLTAAEQAHALAAFGLWDDFANVNFSFVAGAAQITLDNNGTGQAFATHAVSGTSLTDSDIRISSDWDGGNSAFYSYRYQTYIHEIGHALGLGHQGPYNNTANWDTQALWLNDSWVMSVMSYFHQEEPIPDTGTFTYVTGPQMSDIRAMQDHYGIRLARVGDDTYGYNGTAGISYSFTALGAVSSFTVYDSGGNDTLDGSGTFFTQTLDLRSGNHSSLGGHTNNVGIWVTTVIENAIGGGGDDTFHGNTANNVLTGNGSFDTVVFAGNMNQFQFVETNSYSVTGNSQGTDTLNTIERFQFNDMTVTDDAIGGTNTTDSIAVNGFRTGEIQFRGDLDWFRVDLNGGENFLVTLRGSPTADGTLTDPYIRFYDSAGTQIAFNDDGGVGFNSELALRVTTSGTYYVGARRFADSGTGTYLMDLDALGNVSNRFYSPSFELASYGPNAGGWSSNNIYLRKVGDVNGDDLADIIGFGASGLYISTGNDGDFDIPVASLPSFGPNAGGWANNDLYTREIGDVNGDGRDDIIGFGSTKVYISLASGGTSFGVPYADLASFGPNAGNWTSNNILYRTLGDVNGDGRDDIVGFGGAGTYVALAKTAGTPGFNAPFLAVASFGTSAAAGGWANYDTYPRAVADVNGDGREDIIGFGATKTYVSLANAGGTFAAPFVAMNSFGALPAGGGWASFDDYPRLVEDINLDGRADIVGFGHTSIYTAMGNADGTFGPVPDADLASFGYSPAAGGWSSYDLYPRLFGDITGDQRPELLGFGLSGVYASRDFDFVTV